MSVIVMLRGIMSGFVLSGRVSPPLEPFVRVEICQRFSCLIISTLAELFCTGRAGGSGQES